MSDNFKPKTSSSEELLSSFAINNEWREENKPEECLGNSYEIFRNNTTAVEVIVKENKKRKTTSHTSNKSFQDIKIRRLQTDIQILKHKLDETNITMEQTRDRFKVVVSEIKKQLEASNKREIETQMKNLELQFENEKLKTLLDSKSDLIRRLKKEFIGIKSVVKFVIKSITLVPKMNENLTFASDAEYDEFERDLKKDFRVRLRGNAFESADMMTFNSTLSKEDNMNTLEKK